MILKEIKEQTHASHTSLENSPLLRPISDKSLTLGQYITILQKFYGFFYPVEQQIARFPVEEFLPDFAQRRKAGMLLKDLEGLSPHTSATLPLCQELPPVTTLAQAFGCLYVMEGSTLGGKMIYKMVTETLGMDYTQGASFFYGYGSETGNKWKSFQQTLQAVSALHPQAGPQMIEAANQMFDKLRQWFEKDTQGLHGYAQIHIAGRLSSEAITGS